MRLEAQDPATGITAPLYHPRHDQWSEHFAWSVDNITLVGTTAVGRATIAALKLNRPGVVELRSALLQLAGTAPYAQS